MMTRYRHTPTTSISDRLTVLQRHAESDLLAQQVEIWSALNQRPPFMHPRAQSAQVYLAKVRTALDALRAAFDDGSMTTSETMGHLDAVWTKLRDYARTIPALDT